MIEIQIHPSDIRRKVRYFFLGARGVAIAVTGLAIIAAMVIASMTAAPSVIRRTMRSAQLEEARSARAAELAELARFDAEMKAIEGQLDQRRIRVEKLLSVYGLEGPRVGQGGLDLTTDATEDALLAARERERRLLTTAERIEKQVDLIAEYEKRNADIVRQTPSILPLPADLFVLTSPFGNRISPFTRSADFHKGLDFAAPTGTPVLAAADGVVTFAGRYPMARSVAWWRFGNVVVIRHGDRFLTLYAHCDEVKVKTGQAVRQGDLVATVGSTGWSTNSHLHYEVRTDLESPGKYQPIDPRIYILNYAWSDEEQLLISRRTTKEYKDLDPLPSAFIGR